MGPPHSSGCWTWFAWLLLLVGIVSKWHIITALWHATCRRRQWGTQREGERETWTWNLLFIAFASFSILPHFFFSFFLQVVCAKFLSVIWLICQLWEAATEPDQTCNCNEPLMLAFSAKNIWLYLYYTIYTIHTQIEHKQTVKSHTQFVAYFFASTVNGPQNEFISQTF